LKSLKAICLAATLIALPAHAQDQESPQQWLAQAAPALLAEHDVPSVGVALIENGKVVLATRYGEQEWGVEADEETLYNVASLTKPITAEVVMRLAARGEIDLDRPLAQALVDPDIAEDPRAQKITARMVMRHKTGLPHWRYETEGTLKFIADPGEKVGYSGEGYEWMMKAVEIWTGRDFEDLARELVFDPAGMQLTSYTETSGFRGHLAMPYKKGESVRNVVREKPSASDDLRTTPAEYARFMLSALDRPQIEGKLADQRSTVRDVTSYRPACRESERAAFCPPKQGWGLGWFLYDYGNRVVLEHTGGDIGEKAIALFDPGTRRGVVVMTNGANGHKVMMPIAGRLMGDPRLAELLTAPYG